jgi:outer membrane protein OmpA-like peptidoglycan-associated protein
MLDYIENARKQSYPWEAALLPYDDLLSSLGDHLQSDLDFSKGGPVLGPKLLSLIDQRSESLATQTEKLQSNLQETRKSLEGSLSEAQTHLTDARNQIIELEKRIAAVEQERSAAKEASQKKSEFVERLTRALSLFEAGEAVVLRDSVGHIIIRVQSLVFPSGVVTIGKDQTKLLDKVKDAIALFPQSSVVVEGHTDSQGKAEKLQELSEGRAKSVANYLTEKLKSPAGAVKSKGFGSTKPIATNETKEGRTQNRRIDVILIVE